MADLAALKPAIAAEARRLGFTLFGVTTPDPPPHYPVFERWLAAGHHGEMAYLASERSRLRRSDPRQIMPECQSIIVLGMHYAPSSPLPEWGVGPGVRGVPRGRIAAYAWGDDYHDLIPPRLEALAAFISFLTGRLVSARGYSDAGPLLERDLAQRAGLGWIGKNTCLISPRHGSSFFLAELLLDLPLPPDPPFSFDRCGACTRCIDACPTGCILPDRTLDARRCLSYLTIELKELPPPDLRPAVKDWVFGCDICQQVCPWNRFATPAADPALQPRPGLPAPTLATELALTPEEFRQKFKGSPVKRAKRRGYLRNVALALGNSGDPAAAPALQRCLQEQEELLVREAAEWALGRLAGDGREFPPSPNPRLNMSY